MEHNHQAFTLIELLVVVLIIGILAAIAVPQYQKAVLKSRFSSLMPTTKAIRDGNEAYYMTHNRYADALSDLDVTTSPASSAGGKFLLHSEEDAAYIMARHAGIKDKNRYIMYQKHSANFPGEIHCEALQNDAQANWLCEDSLKGTKISGSLTQGYNTYVLEGSGQGQLALHYLSCTEEDTADGKTCEIVVSKDGKSETKTTCWEDATHKNCIIQVADETGTIGDGHDIQECLEQTDSGACAHWSRNKLSNDETGETNTLTDWTCKQWNADNTTCLSYEQHAVTTENGTETQRTNQYYDCWTVSSDGSSCQTYNNETETFDENGNKVANTVNSCAKVSTADGSCLEGAQHDVAFGDDGSVISGTEHNLQCWSVSADGSSCLGGHDNTVVYENGTEQDNTHEWNCSVTSADGNGCLSGTDRTAITDTEANTTYQERFWSCDKPTADGAGCVSGTEEISTGTSLSNPSSTLTQTCTNYQTNGSCAAYSDGSYRSNTSSENVQADWACNEGSSVSGGCSSYKFLNGTYVTKDENTGKDVQEVNSTCGNAICSYIEITTMDLEAGTKSTTTCGSINASTGACVNPCAGVSAEGMCCQSYYKDTCIPY